MTMGRVRVIRENILTVGLNVPFIPVKVMENLCGVVRSLMVGMVTTILRLLPPVLLRQPVHRCRRSVSRDQPVGRDQRVHQRQRRYQRCVGVEPVNAIRVAGIDTFILVMNGMVRTIPTLIVRGQLLVKPQTESAGPTPPPLVMPSQMVFIPMGLLKRMGVVVTGCGLFGI